VQNGFFTKFVASFENIPVGGGGMGTMPLKTQI